MSPLVLAVLVVVCVGAAGAALIPALSSGGRANRRMREIGGTGRAGAVPVSRSDREREARRKSIQDTVRQQTEQLQEQKKRVPLKMRLYQAGMKIKPAGYIRNAVILGASLAITCFFLQVPLLFAAVFGLAGGYLIPAWYVKRRRKKFQTRFLDELPNAVEAIVRGVKSGLPLNDSIKVVAKEVKEPVRSEFARVIDAQAVGKSTDEGIAMIFQRVPLPEVNFLVVVISVQQQSGGNLSEALSNLARVLRDRKKMAAKVKAMSSEAKASAMIIGSLPFIVAALVSFASPNYLTPLISTQVGMICLGVAAVMMSMGIFIMNRMIQFDF